MRRTRWITVMGVGLAMLLAACGGSGDAEPTTTTAGVVTTTTVAALDGSLVVATAGGRFGAAFEGAWLYDFGQATGVEIVMDSSAPGGFAAKLIAQADAGVVTTNLVDMSEEDMYYLYQRGLVAPLPEDLRSFLIEEVGADQVTEYGISFAGYGTVIVCNADLVDKCPKTPAEFFDVEGFPGRRALHADAWWEVPLAALDALGVPKDELIPFDLEAAYAKLDEIQPFINVWFTTGDQAQQIMRDEEVAMAIMWDGRAAGLIDQGLNVEISLVGAPLARDILAVPTNAPNPEIAYEFLKWYATHPEGSVKFLRIARFGVADMDAYDLVPESITRYMTSAPENADVVTFVDVSWLVDNRDDLVNRWDEWLAGG